MLIANLEHCWAAGQDNVSVEVTPDVDGAVLDHTVHRLRDRHSEVGVGKLNTKQLFHNCEMTITIIGLLLIIFIMKCSIIKSRIYVDRDQFL